MIFSEIYSVYYSTVAKILTKALESDVTEKDLQQLVVEQAFSESVMTIMPSLKSEKWQLLHKDLTPAVYRPPTIPLTLLEKRWLKSLADDPRLHLFGVSFSQLDGVEPLFTRKDYKVYDKYSDGDPFEDETYIKHFRLIRQAIEENRPVKITMENRSGKELSIRFYPKGFEYSLKDDKIRVLAAKCRYRYFNLGRIHSCEFYVGNGAWRENSKQYAKKDLTLEITNERNALERAMLHFAHFEKQAERIDEKHYLLKMKYYENDEIEIVIRVLSFGPCVRVTEPESFVELIKNRLISQKSCELK